MKVDLEKEKENKTGIIMKALARRYREEFFIPEFRNKPSGFSHLIDALIIWLHPSRSTEIECFEIKTTRADWLKELDLPSKSDDVAKHCDRIWLVTSDDKIAKLEEIPTNWGWMFHNGKKLKIIKDAPKLNPFFDKDFVITVAQYSKEKIKILLDDAENRGYDKGMNAGKKSWMQDVVKRDYENTMQQLKEYEKKEQEMQAVTGMNFRWESIADIREMFELVNAIKKLKESYSLRWFVDNVADIQKELDFIKEKLKILKEKSNIPKALKKMDD